MIDSRRLSASENLWLEGLRKRLGPAEVLRLSDAVAREDEALVKVFMDVVAKANFQAIEEAMNMSSAAKSLEDVLERTGFYARMEAKTEERNSLKIARNMVASGFPPEIVTSMTELEPEKVKGLYKEEGDSL